MLRQTHIGNFGGSVHVVGAHGTLQLYPSREIRISWFVPSVRGDLIESFDDKLKNKKEEKIGMIFSSLHIRDNSKN